MMTRHRSNVEDREWVELSHFSVTTSCFFLIICLLSFEEARAVCCVFLEVIGRREEGEREELSS